MRQLIRYWCHFQYSNRFRNLHTSCNRRGSAYDGPGKTTVSILNKEVQNTLLIEGCDEMGFLLNHNLKVIGPIILFARSILCWNIASSKDMNEQNLQLFDILEPKLDLLIVGLDDSYDIEFIRRIRSMFKKGNHNVEILPVKQACAAYNFVIGEGRYAAAALVPPKVFKPRMLKLDSETENKELEINKQNSPQLPDR